MTLSIRSAAPGDAQAILGFIEALADYERLRHEVVATVADIERELFGPNPRVVCELAEWEGRPVGFALWFYTFSTFIGRQGIWLEDLFVCPDMRGKGVGKALLAHLARRCVTEELGRFEWAVLDWNTPSIEFYKAQGGAIMDEWLRVRLTGPEIATLAAQ